MPVVNPGLPIRPPSDGSGSRTTRRVRSGGTVPTSSGRQKTGAFRVVRIENDPTVGGQPGTTIIQTGSVSIALTAAASGFADVTFSRVFENAPRVLSNVTNSIVYVTANSGISTTGFRLNIRHVDNTAASTTITANWFAI